MGPLHVPDTRNNREGLQAREPSKCLNGQSSELKSLQARLQQYVNRELPDVQAGFRKGRRTRDQIANIRWIMEKGIALQAMQEKKALSSRGRGRLRGFLELRRPWGFSPERGCIPGSPGESGLVSRGSQGLRSPLESRRGSLGAP